MNILLVEDTPLVQKGVTLFLNAKGHNVDVAENGVNAVSMHKKGYDLILMDYDLPDLNGVEILGAMRAHEKFNDIDKTPIVTFSNRCRDFPSTNFKKIGFTAVYLKLNGEELVNTVEKYEKKSVCRKSSRVNRSLPNSG